MKQQEERALARVAIEELQNQNFFLRQQLDMAHIRNRQLDEELARAKEQVARLEDEARNRGERATGTEKEMPEPETEAAVAEREKEARGSNKQEDGGNPCSKCAETVAADCTCAHCGECDRCCECVKCRGDCGNSTAAETVTAAIANFVRSARGPLNAFTATAALAVSIAASARHACTVVSGMRSVKRQSAVTAASASSGNPGAVATATRPPKGLGKGVDSEPPFQQQAGGESWF
eukprot:2082344-Rhodomonas_salina.1